MEGLKDCFSRFDTQWTKIFLNEMFIAQRSRKLTTFYSCKEPFQAIVAVIRVIYIACFYDKKGSIFEGTVDNIFCIIEHTFLTKKGSCRISFERSSIFV